MVASAGSFFIYCNDDDEEEDDDDDAVCPDWFLSADCGFSISPFTERLSNANRSPMYQIYCACYLTHSDHMLYI